MRLKLLAGTGATLNARRASHASDPSAGILVDQVLDELAAQNLQSDQRFARSLVRLNGQRQGPLRIRATLRAAGVAADIIDLESTAIATDELERAHALWARRFGEYSEERCARQSRFLLNRGFAPEVVAKVMRCARSGRDPA